MDCDFIQFEKVGKYGEKKTKALGNAKRRTTFGIRGCQKSKKNTEVKFAKEIVFLEKEIDLDFQGSEPTASFAKSFVCLHERNSKNHFLTHSGYQLTHAKL